MAGEIDRDRLGGIIFENSKERRRLNQITHPAVMFEIAKQLLMAWLSHHWLVVRTLFFT